MASGQSEDENQAEYLILLLTDSNLPTGGFVASSGLESYHAHGLLTPGPEGLLHFIRLSLETYANSSAAFLLDTHRLVTSHVTRGPPVGGREDNAFTKDQLLSAIYSLDERYHTMTLNHVAQRASKAQGVALLTLYTKSFAETTAESPSRYSQRDQQECGEVIRLLKLAIRSESCHGHLPICWGAFTACLGIKPQRSLQVHLFLQIRAIVSSAIRLNIVGPYLAHRLLAFNAREIIDTTLRVVQSSTTGLAINGTATGPTEVVEEGSSPIEDEEEAGWNWTWPEEGSDDTDAVHTPRMTWPLGDLLQARHDQLHSRLFNS